MSLPNGLQLVVKDEDGQTVGMMFANKKEFSTGSKGYYASGKVALNGDERVQVSANFVLIHSKDRDVEGF